MTTAKWRKNVMSLAEWFCYSRFHSAIFAAIDIAQSASANHKSWVRTQVPSYVFHSLLVGFNNIRVSSLTANIILHI